MSAADCGMCEALGYRTCDLCGGLAFERGPLGFDICHYCQDEQEQAAEPDVGGAARGGRVVGL